MRSRKQEAGNWKRVSGGRHTVDLPVSGSVMIFCRMSRTGNFRRRVNRFVRHVLREARRIV